MSRLAVIDNGKGMTPQTLERIFEPFFTEKRGVRQAGTGLGLSISHAIIENHGGQHSRRRARASAWEAGSS